MALHPLLLLALAASPAPSGEGLSPVPGIPALRQSGIPEIPAPIRERLTQYQNARAASLLDVAEDGSAVLVATRFGSTSQLHLVDRPLAMREQITFFEEPVGQAFLQPGDPRTVWLLRDAGGGEVYQIHRLDRRTGRADLVSDGRSRHRDAIISPDGRSIAWASTARNGKDTDVWLAEVARPREARLLVQGEGIFLPVDFSPDGKRLLVTQFRAITDADLHLVEAQNGERRQLTPAGSAASVRQAAFSADGRKVWLVTDRWSDWNELYLLDPARPGEKPRSVTGSIPWDVEGLAVSRDGTRVAVAVNADGLSRLYLFEPRSGRLSPADIPAGVVGRLRFPARRSSSLFFSLNQARSPSDVWQLDLSTRKVTRWTRSEMGGLDPDRLVDPQLVRYPSADGLAIPAFLYRPPARFPGRRPVVVVWHGGPEGQSRPLFTPLHQFLAAELGLAVLLPNIRGSEGYGKAYLGLDDGIRREASLGDIGATLDFVGSDPALDPDRVAVYGGSYGGYLALATLAFHPGRVRAGVDVVGISSIPTFLESTQAYRRDWRRAEYGDERDLAVRSVLERISPLHHVGRIDAQLFVQQGQNDPRVPRSEAEQIVQAVRQRGQEVWYLLAENEGHGFARKENRDYAQLAAVFFLQRALGN